MINTLDISTNIWNEIGGNFCSDKWIKDNDWNKITVVERIGSESSEGEIYRVELQGIQYAGKIMPIISDKSYEKNENEISIAKELSGNSYFPKVFAAGFCTKTKYNENSKFFENSYKYFLFEKVCEDMNRAIKIRTKHKYKDTTVKELKKIYSEEVTIGSHVLISEIAFADLRQICKYYYVSEKIWKEIILRVLQGIKYLNEDKNILHGDLHCGNILIKIDDKTSPLIHDFGKSIRTNFLTIEERITDPEKFLYDLTLHPDVPISLKEKLEEILKYIRTITTVYPIMNDIILFCNKIFI